MTKLTKLAVLELKNNHLTRIPFAIRRFKWLRTLDLSNNQIESLPSVISRLTLNTLDVSGEKMMPKTLQMYNVSANNENNNDIPQQPAELWVLAAKTVINKK